MMMMMMMMMMLFLWLLARFGVCAHIRRCM
jgi:hypothetical protein